MGSRVPAVIAMLRGTVAVQIVCGDRYQWYHIISTCRIVCLRYRRIESFKLVYETWLPCIV